MPRLQQTYDHRHRQAQGCDIDDHTSCPRTWPHRLDADEVRAIQAMVTSPNYRHVPTGTLAVLTVGGVEMVRKLVAFYLEEHNQRLRHSAFRSQTPDEMYFEKGEAVPDELESARKVARQKRLERNRALSCAVCGPSDAA